MIYQLDVMDEWERRLSRIEREGLRREPKVINAPGVTASTPFGDKLVFCSNDYLGFARHPGVIEAAVSRIERYGLGSGSSRLVSGNGPEHVELEEQFARMVKKESGVLFSSGYQANVGAIGALTGPDDIIFSDELCHASLIDGCRMSRARVVVYRHGDVAHLEAVLKRSGDVKGIRLVLTEGIFSMDGDMPPLPEICRVARENGALVYLDEAHSLGVRGERGEGLAGELGLSDQVAVIVGTFGKAVGASGAVVACDRSAAGLLWSKARSLIYSTAPPAGVCAGAKTGLELVAGASKERDELNGNIALFRKMAQERELHLLPSQSPIQPLIIGDEIKTMELSNALFDEGVFVQGIRPPTVRAGTSRLRITLSALHTSDQLEFLANKLTECGEK